VSPLSPLLATVQECGESGDTADLPPRGGDVRQDREGRLAPRLREGQLLTRAPSSARALTAYLAARATMTTIPVIQPAAPFLDMAGEDLRRRIFLTESETGVELCLRPEFTIPVCLSHIADGSHTPARYAYLGEVFRQRRAGGSEFFQAGIEDLGDENIARADAGSLTQAVEMVRLAAPNAPLEILLGDQTIFEAVLKALGLPRGWRMRLARTFGNAALLKETLADLSNERPKPNLSPAMASLSSKADAQALAAAIAEEMRQSGFPAHAGRSPEDIAARLIEKTELATVRLSKKQFAALTEFLAIREPLSAAPDHLTRFSQAESIDLGAALNAFTARAKEVGDLGLDTSSVTYDAAFGRPLDYYTGLVFEIRSKEKDLGALAGGGRYDRLLTLLGADKPIPGVGFSLWLDRLEALA
jgi:ATP phosphoribosyltransferase regulatory subunit